MTIPNASHPWSPWRPLTAIGWLGFFALAMLLVVAATALADYDDNRAAQCHIRWGTAKTAADSVRVAGDCGLPRKTP